MTGYVVKIGFWLRACDGFVVDADSDAEAINLAKSMSLDAMQSHREQEHVEYGDRREGVIVIIDRVTGDARITVAEDVAFDDDRIHPA